MAEKLEERVFFFDSNLDNQLEKLKAIRSFAKYDGIICNVFVGKKPWEKDSPYGLHIHVGYPCFSNPIFGHLTSGTSEWMTCASLERYDHVMRTFGIARVDELKNRPVIAYLIGGKVIGISPSEEKEDMK